MKPSQSAQFKATPSHLTAVSRFAAMHNGLTEELQAFGMLGVANTFAKTAIGRISECHDQYNDANIDMLITQAGG